MMVTLANKRMSCKRSSWRKYNQRYLFGYVDIRLKHCVYIYKHECAYILVVLWKKRLHPKEFLNLEKLKQDDFCTLRNYILAMWSRMECLIHDVWSLMDASSMLCHLWWDASSMLCHLGWDASSMLCNLGWDTSYLSCELVWDALCLLCNLTMEDL